LDDLAEAEYQQLEALVGPPAGGPVEDHGMIFCCVRHMLGRKYLEWTMRQHIPEKKNNMLSSPVHPLSGMGGRCECGFLAQPLDCVF